MNGNVLSHIWVSEFLTLEILDLGFCAGMFRDDDPKLFQGFSAWKFVWTEMLCGDFPG